MNKPDISAIFIDAILGLDKPSNTSNILRTFLFSSDMMNRNYPSPVEYIFLMVNRKKFSVYKRVLKSFAGKNTAVKHYALNHGTIGTK